MAINKNSKIVKHAKSTAKKEAVIKARPPAKKEIIKKETPKLIKKEAKQKEWKKIQTAEGWKRGMLKSRKAAK